MTGGSEQYWLDQQLTPEQQLASVAAEYADKIVAAYPRATPGQLTAHVAAMSDLATRTFSRRFGSPPPSPMAAALATALDARLLPTP